MNFLIKNLTLTQFSLLSQKEKRYYAVARADKYYGISDAQFSLLSPKEKRDYVVVRANKGYILSDEKFSLLSPKAKEEYYYIIKMRRLFSNNKTALEKFQVLMREKYKLKKLL